MKAVWEDHDGPLPTLPGCIGGIIAMRLPPQKKYATVQCSACCRTVTDLLICAVTEINFARGYEIPGSGGRWSEPGTLMYRRCRDCRVAGRHPEGAP